MQTIYTQLKVNNEYEICEVMDVDMKPLIEKELLKYRISYYIRWQYIGVFRNRRAVCIFCVNESVKDKATEIIKNMDGYQESKIKMVCRKNGKSFL